LPDNKIGVS